MHHKHVSLKFFKKKTLQTVILRVLGCWHKTRVCFRLVFDSLLWPRVSVCEWRRCLCPGGYPFHKKIIKTKPQWNGIWKRYLWRLWLWLLSAPAWKFNTRNFLLIFFGSHQDGHHGIGDKLHGAFSSTSRQQRFKRLTRIEETVMLQLRHSLLKGPE